MREKIYNVLNKVYGGILIVAFFAGILPLIPFIVAIIIGGETGEAISVFLYDQYYPWVIVASAISVIIGWVALYIGGKVKTKPKKENRTNKKSENSTCGATDSVSNGGLKSENSDAAKNSESKYDSTEDTEQSENRS